MPRRAWARRAVLSLLGMVVPVCECGNVPFARGLHDARIHGARDADLPHRRADREPDRDHHDAPGVRVRRRHPDRPPASAATLIANLIGWLYSRHPDPDALLTDRFRATCELVAHEPGGRGRRSLAQFVIELRAVMPALVIGSALAGAVQVLVPREALLAIGSNPALSIVAMMALAMVVAICSNVDCVLRAVVRLDLHARLDRRLPAGRARSSTSRCSRSCARPSAPACWSGWSWSSCCSAFAIGAVVNLLA